MSNSSKVVFSNGRINSKIFFATLCMVFSLTVTFTVVMYSGCGICFISEDKASYLSVLFTNVCLIVFKLKCIPVPCLNLHIGITIIITIATCILCTL